MTERIGGETHPTRTHETLDAAVKYAQQRSSEKQCEISVRDQFGTVLHVFEAGEDKMVHYPEVCQEVGQLTQ